jgi:hypothetical protein
VVAELVLECGGEGGGGYFCAQDEWHWGLFYVGVDGGCVVEVSEDRRARTLILARRLENIEKVQRTVNVEISLIVK